MSGIAKGRAVVSEVDLKRLLGLPDEVEIVSLLHLGDGVELKLASKEPTKFTHCTDGSQGWQDTVRAVRLPIKN